MSDINTIVFDQKTIDQLDPYIPEQDGEIIQDQSIRNTKFPFYIKTTTIRTQMGSIRQTVNKTKSISLKKLQDLLKDSDNTQYQNMSQSDLNRNSQNYDMSMLISPRILNNQVEYLISNNKEQATYNPVTNRGTTGLMSGSDKVKLETFNLTNGSQIGSLRTKNSKQESSNYHIGEYAFAEGYNTAAQGRISHAQGQNSIASGYASHAEGGNTIAQGDYSHTNGYGTIAGSMAQTVIGKNNEVDNNNQYALIIGNGGDTQNKANALTVDWNGNVKSFGTPQEEKDLTTKKYVDNAINNHTNEIVNNIINNKKIGNINLIDLIYPIGSIYISVNSTSPASLFGGTWERLKDTFLFASGDIYPADADTWNTAQHGQAEVTLSADQSGLPAHSHGFIQPNISMVTGISTGNMSTNNTVSGSFDIRAWGTSGGDAIVVGSHYTNGNGSSMNGIAAQSDKNYTSQRITFSQNIQHTHNIPDHNHIASGGTVQQIEARSAISPHTNMPPYLSVYIWKRIEDSTSNYTKGGMK